SANLLTTPPKYDMPVAEPAYLRKAWAFDLSRLPAVDPNEALRRLLGSPNGCSRRWIWEQYDHMVQTNTVVTPGADAAVLRIKNGCSVFGVRCSDGSVLPSTEHRTPNTAFPGIALTIDGNSRLVYLDPYEGARLAV